ncbi:MAG: DinB family protein [Phycisphaerales bacterium]|nr:DinB family protein [Phycisphaerales bacterium]
MMNPLLSAISTVWARNGAYAARLVGDLTPGQFLDQPVPGVVMNHPAWILSHLLIYKTIAARLLRGEPFEDPLAHPYGPKSRPGPDASAYLPPSDLLRSFQLAHADVGQALNAAPPDLTSRPVPLERWRAMAPTIGDLLLTLMVKHESHHLGQLSAWRRAMTLPPVEM